VPPFHRVKIGSQRMREDRDQDRADDGWNQII